MISSSTYSDGLVLEVGAPVLQGSEVIAVQDIVVNDVVVKHRLDEVLVGQESSTGDVELSQSCSKPFVCRSPHCSLEVAIVQDALVASNINRSDEGLQVLERKTNRVRHTDMIYKHLCCVIWVQHGK